MPQVCLHLTIAKATATRLRHPVLEGNLGSYLLGSTAPDMRLLSGATREETHFFDLSTDSEGSGVDALFACCPSLHHPEETNSETMSFIAGYLSHLVTDEIWLTDIYRPFFGQSSSLGSDPWVKVLDRMLQYELDRRERLDAEGVAQLRAELEGSDEGVQVEFIAAADLGRWRGVVIEFIGRELTWDRFRPFIERFLRRENVAAEGLEQFFADLPQRLANVLSTVSEWRIQEFRERSIERSREVAEDYLC